MMMRRAARRLALLLLAGFVVLNALAYVHARSFTTFATDGRRTPDPETMRFTQKLGVLLTGPTLPRPRIRETPFNLDLAFETHHFRTSDGLTLEAWRIPLTPDIEPRGMVLLFHGYGDSKSSLLTEARVFHSMGYEPVLVDFRGSGGSEGDTTTIGYDEAEDVWTSVAYAGRWPGSRHLVVFGSSMGAAAVLRAAAIHDLPVDALILQAPFASLTEAVEHRFQRLHAPSFPAAKMLVFWGGVQQGFDGLHHDPVRYAERVRVPVLLLHGARDPLACLDEARAIHAHLAGRKELVVFPRASHQSLYRADRPRWRAAVTTFLAS